MSVIASKREVSNFGLERNFGRCLNQNRGPVERRRRPVVGHSLWTRPARVQSLWEARIIRCKNLALYIRDCESLCLSDETVKAVGPFYLVSMPGEVKDPTQPQGVNV